MQKKNIIRDEYFWWLYDKVETPKDEYVELLMLLHSIEFFWKIPLDENRAKDGLALRVSFATECGYLQHVVDDALNTPCSVLEMMVALADRCEVHIMEDPDKGNRTGLWFWTMIDNLGLSEFRYGIDEDYIREIIDQMLNRKYARNGEGGLFTVNNGKDIRRTEIWYQLCWYLNESVIR